MTSIGQRESNRRVYERRVVGERHAKDSHLHAVEIAAFARYRGEIAGKRILDLGVGAGRTTKPLVELGADYAGVDYSQEMIGRCRARFPEVRFELADARNLSAFEDRRFDFILFSNNGIDAVGHEDRLAILGEVWRVLSPHGLFVFSSHNRNFNVPKPWSPRHLAINPLRHPLRFGKRTGSVLLGLRNYLRHAGQSRFEEDYCIRVDSAFSYSLVHYGITRPAQQQQLDQAGFDILDTLGVDGRFLSDDEVETKGDAWLQYVCRKRA